MRPVVTTVTLNPAIDHTIVVERLLPGQVHRAESVQVHPGGKGINVASCLADWGVGCQVSGLLGDANPEAFDQLLRQPLLSDGMLRVAGANRRNIKILDRVLGQTTDLNPPGIDANPALFDALLRQLDASLQADDVLVLAGSLPPGLDADSWQRLAALGRARGARVLLDTSGAALDAALRAEHSALPQWIKPNRDELQAWFGESLGHQAAVLGAARKLLQLGIERVVVSMGADGALFVDADEALRVAPPAQRHGSSVGAGDAMVAGLVSAWLDQLSLTATARRATAFAAAKLDLSGPHLPARAEVLALADRCHVEAIRY